MNPSEAGPLLIACGEAPERDKARRMLQAKIERVVDRAGLVLLMLAIGALLLRPADVVPALAGAPLYEFLILSCLALSLSRLARQLTLSSLAASPVTAMALFMPIAVIASHLWNGDTWSAQIGGMEAIKAAVLFLLVVGHVNTARKLIAVLAAAALSVLGITVLALANSYGIVRVEALQNVTQTGSEETIVRLCGTGIFNDPNDFSMVLVLSLVVCILVIGRRDLGPRRWLALIPLMVFGHGLMLTHSRGGLIAAIAGMVAYLGARYRWRNALPGLAMVALVAMSPFFGRQSQWNLSDREDTFQARLELWSSAMDEFRSHPVLGIGQGKLVDAIGQVAHNSFLQAFAELGILGGIAFVGGFALLIRSLWRCSCDESSVSRLRPYMLAIVAGYAAGLLSLTRCYTVPTQLVLALGAAYLNVVGRAGGARLPRLDAKTLRFAGAAGLAFLVMTYVFVRVMINRGF